MMRQLEAVFEGGILRPLEPLPLAENQHVILTIEDAQARSKISARAAEQEWLRLHRNEHKGDWVALQGDSLLSHGPDARAVRDEARAKGIEIPLLVHIPDEPDLPSAGWL